MAEECRYYYYDNGYSCALKREKEGDSSIDSDTVYRYCWGYHYSECPRYKVKESSGGCFLTSACVEAKGLSDNCHELKVLRDFRDQYMSSLPSGPSDIAEYYRIAPAIVTKIKTLPDEKEIFDCIYSELVLPCVELIENGKKYEAYLKYKMYTKDLQEIYSL